MIPGLVSDQAIISDRKFHVFLDGEFSAKPDLRGITADFRSIDRERSATIVEVEPTGCTGASDFQIRMVFSVTALNVRCD